jgi:hypothetical protein
LRTAILNNRRAVFDAAGNPTGQTVSDPRANLQIFGPSRTQLNKKELMRYVVGLRGETESLGFINDINYELSYTYGKLENQNFESAVDVVRFKHSADAVVDTAGRVNGRPGEIVCRVKLLAAQGRQIPDQLRGGFYNPTNPDIANCVPSRVFGVGGYSQAARNYFDATIRVFETNEQQDALGFVSGNLWDLWGAGPMGVALGAEYREEKTSGIGRSRDTGDRLLFLNTGPDAYPCSRTRSSPRLSKWAQLSVRRITRRSARPRPTTSTSCGVRSTTSRSAALAASRSAFRRSARTSVRRRKRLRTVLLTPAVRP